MSSEEVIVNGWILCAHSLFLDQYENLVGEVEALKKKDPENYQKKNATKRLAAIQKLIFESIPNDPSHPEFRLGGTLGEEHKHWFRAKFFQQYRLFFRFHKESKIIVFGWVNDESTKRAYDSKSDAYATFKKMLANKKPPTDWDCLLTEARLQNKRFGETKPEKE